MPLDYELDSQLKELTEISADCLDWFLTLSKTMFFSSVTLEQKQPPQSVNNWLNQSANEAVLEHALIDTLRKRFERLTNCSQNIKTPPEQQAYEELSEHFEKFMDTLRRAEKELILDKSGIDDITGMRRKWVMHKDLEREMQRLARQGKPFSLALVRLNNFIQIEQEEGEEGTNKYLEHIAKLMKQSLRSFDDAYRIGADEFVLSLKQADVSGGIRALERLKELLEANDYTFTSKKLKDQMPSLSCCVAEPVYEDKVEELIANMREDMKEAEQEEQTLLEYYELSPLQRFVKQNNATDHD